MKHYIYFKALKHANHTVFCVGDDGQKKFWDPQFNRYVAYSSGQQVKRSILQTLVEDLNVPMAPITFNYNINDGKLENKEPWAPCDPTYVDQLIGGWMRMGSDENDKHKEKRRSPLSISAMLPLHPLLATVYNEAITFDRSDCPDYHPVNVRKGKEGKLLTEEEIEEFLKENNRTLPRRVWIPKDKNWRTSGLFVHDIAIDLRTLFCISINRHEPELTEELIDKMKSSGWIEGKNVFGNCLILPKEQRERIIPALAKAFINWRITSNQSRTFSPMETLAVAISDNANTLAAAIRAKLSEGDKENGFIATPIVEDVEGSDLFVYLPCANYVLTNNEKADALKNAEDKLVKLMMDFDYENQI